MKLPESTYGDWMIVQDSRRGRRPNARGGRVREGQKKIGKEEKKSGMSRYTMLEIEEETGAEVAQGVVVRRPLREITNDISKGEGRQNDIMKPNKGVENMKEDMGETKSKGKGCFQVEKTKNIKKREVKVTERRQNGETSGMKKVPDVNIIQIQNEVKVEAREVGPEKCVSKVSTSNDLEGAKNIVTEGGHVDIILGQKEREINGPKVIHETVMEDAFMDCMLDDPPDNQDIDMALNENEPLNLEANNSFVGLSDVDKVPIHQHTIGDKQVTEPRVIMPNGTSV